MRTIAGSHPARGTRQGMPRPTLRCRRALPGCRHRLTPHAPKAVPGHARFAAFVGARPLAGVRRRPRATALRTPQALEALRRPRCAEFTAIGAAGRPRP